MPYDRELADRMRDAVADHPGITEKKMFGGICWMLNGNMLSGVEVGRYMFRVGKEAEETMLTLPGASPMDITGRPMRGIIWVQAEEALDYGLARWVDHAIAFVGGLPPK